MMENGPEELHLLSTALCTSSVGAPPDDPADGIASTLA